jgi:hypothetical protein
MTVVALPAVNGAARQARQTRQARDRTPVAPGAATEARELSWPWGGGELDREATRALTQVPA